MSRQRYHLGSGKDIDKSELAKYLDHLSGRLATAESVIRAQGFPTPKPLGASSGVTPVKGSGVGSGGTVGGASSRVGIASPFVTGGITVRAIPGGTGPALSTSSVTSDVLQPFNLGASLSLAFISYMTPGTFTYSTPDGTTSLHVILFGAGGGGGSGSNGVDGTDGPAGTASSIAGANITGGIFSVNGGAPGTHAHVNFPNVPGNGGLGGAAPAITEYFINGNVGSNGVGGVGSSAGGIGYGGNGGNGDTSLAVHGGGGGAGAQGEILVVAPSGDYTIVTGLGGPAGNTGTPTAGDNGLVIIIPTF